MTGGFFEALWHHSFLQHALLMGLLAAIACGAVGTFVVARRITYLAAGIAHAVLGGMGAAHYFRVVHGVSWLHPLIGAAVAALAAALIIGLVSLYAKEREDTAIGALWAMGMAVGVIFISMTPGYNQDLMSYLFGNILMVSSRDLWLIAALDAVVIGIVLAFYNQFAAVCFDEEFARVRGVSVEFFYLLLLVLTAITVVILVTVVGLIMVIALLTIPVAAAGRFARTLWQTMALAAVLSAVLTSAGLAVSFSANLPTGATIILLAGILYLAVSALRSGQRRSS
jgi:zinc transport system permease protein